MHFFCFSLSGGAVSVVFSCFFLRASLGTPSALRARPSINRGTARGRRYYYIIVRACACVGGSSTGAGIIRRGGGWWTSEERGRRSFIGGCCSSSAGGVPSWVGLIVEGGGGRSMGAAARGAASSGGGVEGCQWARGPGIYAGGTGGGAWPAPVAWRRLSRANRACFAVGWD